MIKNVDEALKILRQYNSVGLCGYKTLFDPIEKDLEELEELKKIMGTPIQDIMKNLKELEKVKSFVVNQTAFYDTGCCLDEYIYYDSEIGTIFKRWNEE